MNILKDFCVAIEIVLLMFVVLWPLEALADVLVTVSWDAVELREDGTSYLPKVGAVYEIYEIIDGDMNSTVVPFTQLSQTYTKPEGYSGSFAMRAIDSNGLASELSEVVSVSSLPPIIISSPPQRSGLRITIEQL